MFCSEAGEDQQAMGRGDLWTVQHSLERLLRRVGMCLICWALHTSISLQEANAEPASCSNVSCCVAPLQCPHTFMYPACAHTLPAPTTSQLTTCGLAGAPRSSVTTWVMATRRGCLTCGTRTRPPRQSATFRGTQRPCCGRCAIDGQIRAAGKGRVWASRAHVGHEIVRTSVTHYTSGCMVQ